MFTSFNFRSSRSLLTLLAMVMSIAVFGQSRPKSTATDPINAAHKSTGIERVKIAPFTTTAATPEYEKNVRTATWLAFDASKVQPVLQNRPRFLQFDIPNADGSKTELLLERAEPTEQTMKVHTPNGIADYTPGVHYRGYVADRSGNREGSLAAISIFEGEVFGVISTEAGGNYCLGRLGNRASTPGNRYVFYQEKNLLANNPFNCGTDDVKNKLGSSAPQGAEMVTPNKRVRVYAEVDNTLYANLGSSVTNAVNYATAQFNITSMIYEREDVITQLSDIFVWTSADPYNATNSGTALNDFVARLNAAGGFNGNLAHLFSADNTGGGIAWIDVLCWGNVGQRSAYSGGLSSALVFFPTYTWENMVITHEMGHNLGSNHTQWCGWSGGAIDNCYTTEGGCAAGPAPINGGTIMSYCHLTAGGINLNHGFGWQPGNTIRNEIAAAPCLGTVVLNCGAAEEIFSGIPKTGSTAGWTNNVNSYSCVGWTESGPERVYRFVMTEPGNITALLSGLSADVDVFILSACSELNCLAYGNDAATAYGVQAGEYMIVVDGYLGASGSFTLNVSATGGYCFTNGNTDDEWINQVQVGTFSNISGNNMGFGNFTNQLLGLQKGVDAAVTLTPGFRSTAWNEAWKIWVDLNGNSQYEAGENVFASAASNAAATGNINIPHGTGTVNGGWTKMRVQMRYSVNTADPCGEIGYGESEDYSVFLDDYCLSRGTNTTDEWISNVQINGVNYFSGQNYRGYGHFLNQKFVAQKGVATPVTLTPGFNATAYAEAWRMWVDLNNDYDFDDAGEEVFNAPASNAAVSSTFTIPNTVANGIYRMRVQMQYSAAGGPCQVFAYGEVEDYLIQVGDYCAASGYSGLEHISNVLFGSITSFSGNNSGYGDFSSLSTNLPIGRTTNFSATPGFSSAAYLEGWAMYIDYNRDGDFSDNGELVSTIAPSNTTVSGSVNVPVNATPGLCRMRLIMQYGNVPSAACLTNFDGEVEDYTVNLVKDCTASTGMWAVPQSLTTAYMAQDQQSGIATYWFRYRKVGVVAWTQTSATVPYKSIASLTSGATYEYQMRTRCADLTYTAYSPSQFFVMPASGDACGPTTAGGARSITATGATIYYAHKEGATRYRIQYREIGAAAWIQVETTAKFRALTGLTPNTTYEWRVASRCGAAAWQVFTAPLQFRTLPTLSLEGAGDDRSDDSEMETVDNSKEKIHEFSLQLRVAPNPFTDAVSIEFESEMDGAATLEVMNVAGQTVRSEKITVQAGTNSLVFNANEWNTGVYVIRLSQGEQVQIAKVVKQ